MAVYLSPGVYIEEIPSGVRPIEGGGTSTALFAGHALRGPVGTAVLVTGFDAYEQLYGGIRDTGAEPEGDALGHSVRAFFQNGGTRAYVARLVRDDPDPEKRAAARKAACAVALVLHPTEPMTTLIRLTAKNEGTWARALRVQIAPSALSDARIRVDIGPEIAAPGGSRVQPLESFDDVSLVAGEPGFIKDRLEVESKLADAGLEPVEPFMLGTSTSQPLNPLTGTFDQLNGRTMTVRVNGTNRVVTFPAAGDADAFTAATTLDDVAGFTEEVVRGQTTTPATRDFTCTVRDDRLVLTSGKPEAMASVVVTGPDDDTDAAAFLRLGLDNEGEERTGAQTLADLVGTGGKPVPFTGGVDREPPKDVDYQGLFTSLLKVRDINIVTLPGRRWNSDDQTSINHALTYAEDTKRCMVLVDPPNASELSTPSQIQALGVPTSTYSVMYYPWLRVTNPFFDRERNPGVPATVLVPPSGFAAGLWAKTDGRRGVWKAPAGVEFQLLGSAGPSFDVDDIEQQALNPLGINAIRRLPNFGQVVWGARTLSTLASPEWRYVPVRRTAIFIEQSIYDGIQWAVFEPNDHRLWASLRANIASFMDGLFRSGAFQGETAQQAYFVRCNLGDSMTQDDIDAGRVIVIVGFAPVKPAEFVIIRLQQKVGQQ